MAGGGQWKKGHCPLFTLFIKLQAHALAREAITAALDLGLFRAAVKQQWIGVIHMDEYHPRFFRSGQRVK